jgi:hypothetical protein
VPQEGAEILPKIATLVHGVVQALLDQHVYRRRVELLYHIINSRFLQKKKNIKKRFNPRNTVNQK